MNKKLSINQWGWLLVVGLFLSQQAYAAEGEDTSVPVTHDESAPVSLEYKAVTEPVTFLTSFKEQRHELINMTDEFGKTKVFTKESYAYVETRKEMTREKTEKSDLFGARSTDSIFHSKYRVSFIKSETNKGTQKFARSQNFLIMHDAHGRLNDPFRWELLSILGFPILFSSQSVLPGQGWDIALDFSHEGLPPLTLKGKANFMGTKQLAGHSVAEIHYHLLVTVSATQLSQDSLWQQKILALRQQGVENVSFMVEGELTFDNDSGLLVTHQWVATEKMTKSTLESAKRTLQEQTSTLEYAEALIP